VAEPVTDRGRETRERIVLSAARLFQESGVSATSVDEILFAAGAGKGQFYRYFESKERLVSAVVSHRVEGYLAGQLEALERLETWEELEGYLSGLVAGHEERGFLGGCPVGALALELAGEDEDLRRRLAEALAGWQGSLVVGLRGLIDRGLLRDDAVPERLATSLLATVQGAYLLSTVHRDGDVMAEALREALWHLRAHAETPGADAETPRDPSAGGTV